MADVRERHVGDMRPIAGRGALAVTARAMPAQDLGAGLLSVAHDRTADSPREVERARQPHPGTPRDRQHVPVTGQRRAWRPTPWPTDGNIWHGDGRKGSRLFAPVGLVG